ncbi:SDR family NAD(P)-dependent oxidoreductase [Paenibacillaceae bacterium]|nr:SDR family NAD(P)-dependent oxidoreductase [Paenibacillaceae bacterium]
MKDLFIAGGTSGMGKGLAMHYLRQGSKVTVTGSNPLRGKEFLDEAERSGAASRAFFIQADLSSLLENRRVIQEVQARHESLDGLVLTAMQQFPKRKVTSDGYESTFALYYISRFVLSYGLTELLEKGNNPVIVSIGGTGMTKGEVHWDDLQLEHKYGLLKATLQGGRANDLLGVAYAENHKNAKTRFILNHPGYTNSGTNHLSQPFKTILGIMGKLFAQPVEKSIQPIIKLMDHPSPQSLIAWDRTKAVDLSLRTLNKRDAMKLYQVTKHIL